MKIETLAVKLASRRRRSGLTQAELARRMGTSQSFIARVESAKVMPGLDVIDRWARATGIPLHLTLGAPPIEPSAEERTRRVIRAFGENAFDPWKRNPSAVERQTLHRLGITPVPGTAAPRS